MPIDKRTPRVLNADADNKTINKVSMLDALNVYAGDEAHNLFGNQGSTYDGGAGVLKNIKGTELLSSPEGEGLPNDARLIGSVEDQKTDITYLFIYSSSAPNHGIWAYDRYGKLPDSTQNSIRLIYKSAQFNFPQNGFVKGDIVRTNSSKTFPELGVEFDKDALIYFTDNKNEPRKVNAYRAIQAQSGIHGSNSFAEADFITACPKVPLDRIEFEFNNDESKSVSNFKTSGGFQFAYQNIYRDGMESAISVYSKIAFPPNILDQGANQDIDLDFYNRCVLTIPQPGPEIKAVRLLARQGNLGYFFIIDEIEADNFNPTYSFYNDRVVTGISENEVNKQFDNLPRIAESQTVSSNRMMYGNYQDGYDNVESSCSVTIQYLDRPEDFQDFNITVDQFIGKHDIQQGDDDPYTGFPEMTSFGVPPDQSQSPFGFLSFSESRKRRSAGFVANFSEIPDTIKANARIKFKVTVSPDGNWHLFGGFNTYHGQSPRVGRVSSDSFDLLATGDNHEDNLVVGENLLTAEEAGNVNSYGYGSNIVPAVVNTANFGMEKLSYAESGAVDSVRFKTVDINGQTPTDQVKTAVYGVGASTPFVIEGKSITFEAEFVTNQQINGGLRNIVKTTVKEMLAGPSTFQEDGWEDNLTYSNLFVPGYTLRKNTSSYSIDKQLTDGQLIGQAFVGTQIDGSEQQVTDPLSKLIIPIFDVSGGTSNSDSTIPKSPIGNVIVNKAKPTFDLEKVDEDFHDIGSNEVAFRICMRSLYDVDEAGEAVDLEVRSLIRSGYRYQQPENYPNGNNGPYLSWIVLPTEERFFNDFNNDTSSFLLAYTGLDASSNYDPNTGEISATGGLGIWERHYWQPQEDVDTGDYGSSNPGYFGAEHANIGKLNDNVAVETPQSIGYMRQVGFITNPERLFVTPPGTFAAMLFDGEGGPGGGLSRGGDGNQYDRLRLYNQGTVSCTPQAVANATNATRFYWGKTVFFDSRNEFREITSIDVNTFITDSNCTALPLIGNNISGSWSGVVNFEDYDFYKIPYKLDPDDEEIAPESVNYKIAHSSAEVYNPQLSVEFTDPNSRTTFKSSANHDFGIVYYDERGRHGFVNHLQNVDYERGSSTIYVPGYSSQERGGTVEGGATNIILNLQHSPPSWAHYYKIVYSKNSSVQNFVQYSAGGAFVPENLEDNSDTNIYVSLNYLQSNEISYVNSFGARNSEGGINMYKFREGDKLRVISYQSSAQGNRTYVFNYEFDVVDLVDLGDDNNPLAEEPAENQKGEFIKIKNNALAEGFNFFAVHQGTDLWNRNCIIEIFTPYKQQDPEDRVYYEVGDTYNVIFDGDPESSTYQQLIHSVGSVTVNEGDVWFRRVAVNLRDAQNGYQDIIVDEVGVDDEDSSSNFRSFYLETESANDLFRSNSVHVGRPNIAVNGAISVRRESSITYSEPSAPEAKTIKYSSFNGALNNFKDLPESHGNLNYISDYGDYLFCLQEDKVSIVPVNKNILSDLSGNANVIASAKVLGEAVFYSGNAGCDNDPSSVYDSGEEVYFADKSLSKVYRWTKGAGVETISDLGMRSFLRTAFNKAIQSAGQVRIVGGYDPLKEEYLLTINNLPIRTTSSDVDEVLQITDIIQLDLERKETDDETLEFMSAQQAIDYLISLKNEEDTSLHPTYNQIRSLIDEGNSTMNLFRFDSSNDNNVGVSDMLTFLAGVGVQYDSGESIFYEPENRTAQSSLPPPPLPSKMPSFKSTQQAIDYLISAGNLLAGEFSILRYYIKNEVALNLDGTGEVNINDLLALLTVFGQSSIYSDSAWGQNYPGATISDPQISGLDAILYIIDQGDMNVGQYFQLAQYVKVNLRANANPDPTQASPDATVGAVTTADVLVILSYGLFGDTENVFGYDLNDLAFNNLLPE